jgi:hypothetical protein
MARVGGGKGTGQGRISMQVIPDLLSGMLTRPAANNALADAMNVLTGNDFDMLAWCAVYIHAYCY